MKKTSDLRPFFEPTGVALVGVSRSPGFGYGIPLTLQRQGWQGAIHLVNLAGGTLHGMPVYERVADVPDPVDLAIVLVPARFVSSVLPEIAARGIRHVIIETAGFAEIGEAGRAMQAEAAEVAAGLGLRIIGPNCVGVVNTANHFTSVEIMDEALTPGPVSIIAQSGVFGNILLDGLWEKEVFIAKAVTLGNRLDVNECEILDYLHRDEDTRVIMMYLEGAADGRLLLETLARVTRDKPVIILKGGRTPAGRAATASHTASLSGEDQLYEAVFRQTGAIRAPSLDQLVRLARIFTTQPLPGGNRLGIITGSGSLGVLATDSATAGGLTLPALSSSTESAVREAAPDWMNVRNPLDTGPSGQFPAALSAVASDEGIDMVLGITVLPYAVFSSFEPLGLTAPMWFGDIRAIHAASPSKPMAICAIGNERFIGLIQETAGSEVPVFDSPEGVAAALASLAGYAAWKRSLD